MKTFFTWSLNKISGFEKLSVNSNNSVKKVGNVCRRFQFRLEKFMYVEVKEMHGTLIIHYEMKGRTAVVCINHILISKLNLAFIGDCFIRLLHWKIGLHHCKIIKRFKHSSIMCHNLR